MPTDRDYVLGTHDEELARLGLQHRVWCPVVLDCWQRAGLTVGKRVLDVMHRELRFGKKLRYRAE